MTYVIALPCVDLLDKTCIDVCPVDCIYEGERMLYIHPDECVDCGACEPICPVEAISFEADVPAQWKGFYRINVEFFDELGSPGGGSRVGRIGRDHPVVAALPPPKIRQPILLTWEPVSGFEPNRPHLARPRGGRA
jgi:NAD-dependent dihydropyrimidine dehydrogenase PreA subunit